MKKSMALIAAAAGLLSVGVWGAESDEPQLGPTISPEQNTKWAITDAHCDQILKRIAEYYSPYQYPVNELKKVFEILSKEPNDKITPNSRFYIERARFIITYWRLRNQEIMRNPVNPKSRKAVLEIPQSAFLSLALYSAALRLDEDKNNNTSYMILTLDCYGELKERCEGMTDSEKVTFYTNIISDIRCLDKDLTHLLFAICDEELELCKRPPNLCRIIPSEKNFKILLDKAKYNADLFIKRKPDKSKDEIKKAFEEIKKWENIGK